MFGQRLYFLTKPIIPWPLRLAARRIHAFRLLRRSEGVWPIDPSAGEKPEGWPGWPNGKQFALVLTHDVERRWGVERVRRLAELEMELGFRSSFNFIPEGEYEVPEALRAWLSAHGFEVGVHDLHHDGRLFYSRTGFGRKAERINSYLQAWGAVGFRSGYMLRNLDWIRNLDIAYDASTFDTDPFEPQPEGVGTIFPFWVPKAAQPPGIAPNGANALSVDSTRLKAEYDHLPGDAVSEVSCSGYVELPYTLPQDLTLFNILSERTPRIWKTKLDWIAERSGMALLNVHPDYLDFGGEHLREPNYPVELYKEFLMYAKTRYDSSYWHILPRTAAQFWTKRVYTRRSCLTS